jgi:hypothetical protein
MANVLMYATFQNNQDLAGHTCQDFIMTLRLDTARDLYMEDVWETRTISMW